MTEYDQKFMRRAIELAIEGMKNNAGGPFGCVVVKDGEILSEGYNSVTSKNDPTAHAEVVAIRKACEKLETFQLNECTVYTSCEPCPMCLGAIYWARPAKVYYGCSREDAAAIEFDDQFIYDELDLSIGERKIPFDQLMRDEARMAFDQWAEKEDRTEY
jgi:tRNA(Arg) A34 adenosine deaminase TadA